MNKLFLFVVALLAFGCSAEMPTDAENLGEAQEALGTCTKPTGTSGDTTFPFDRYIYAIHVAPGQPWKMEVEEKMVATGIVIVNTIDFGGVDATNSQAHMAGPGWTGLNNARLYDSIFLLGNGSGASYGCPTDPNLICWVGWDTVVNVGKMILTFDKRWSAPSNTHMGLSAGLTAINGVGATDAQKLAFTYNNGTGATTVKKLFTGPKLDACLYP